MLRPRPITALLAFTAALVVAAVAPATTALSEQPVLTGPRHHTAPAVARAGGSDVLLWTERPAGRATGWTAYLRKGSGAKLKLNTKGLGFTGGIDPPWVAYQQVVGNNSDIKLYRLDKRKRFDPPKGLNTKDWEYSPSISGQWVFFGRDDLESNLQRVVLFNRKTRRSRVLTTINGADNFLIPGQVNGNWAVWTTCNPDCRVVLYNIGAKAKTTLAAPSGLINYSAGVTRTGVVYSGRSGDGCGADARIVRFRRSDDPPTGTEIAVLPAGFDFVYAFARSKPNGTVEFLYDRRPCSSGTADIYKVTDPAPPPR